MEIITVSILKRKKKRSQTYDLTLHFKKLENEEQINSQLKEGRK